MSRRTRNAVAPSSPTNEPIDRTSKGIKRARDTAIEDAHATKNLKTSRISTAIDAGKTDAAAQELLLSGGKLPLDPKRRPSRKPSQPIAQSSSSHQTSLKAPRELHSPHRATAIQGSKAPVLNTSRLSRETRSGRLGRPNGIRGRSKKAPSKGGESVYDVVPDDSPRRQRKLPAVAAKVVKKRTRSTKTTRTASANTGETNAKDGKVQQSTPQKRGGPRKGTEEGSPRRHAMRSSTRGSGVNRQNIKDRSMEGSKESSKSKVSRNPAFSNSRTQKEMSENEDDASDAEDETEIQEEVTNEGRHRDTIVNQRTLLAKDMETPVSALLGQERSWDEILEGVRKNCPDPNENESGQSEATCKTKPIQALIKDIKKVFIRYQDLEDRESEENAQRDAEKSVSLELDDIERRIYDIKKFDVGENRKRKAHETFRDIYLHGVPNMIYLLRAAIQHRFSASHDCYDLESIREVIRIQDMTIHLCRTATLWKVKPAVPEKKPIVKCIKSIVFPRLRDNLKKAFYIEVERLVKKEKKAQNLGKSRAQATQSAQYVHEEIYSDAEKKAQTLRRIAEDIKQTQDEYRVKILKLPTRFDERHSMSLQPRHSSHHPEHQHGQWTRAELLELLIQLQKEDSRYLPAAERYLKILNTPLLQNKLPDHIRQKALEYKPILMETLEEAEFIRSIE